MNLTKLHSCIGILRNIELAPSDWMLTNAFRAAFFEPRLAFFSHVSYGEFGCRLSYFAILQNLSDNREYQRDHMVWRIACSKDTGVSFTMEIPAPWLTTSAVDNYKGIISSIQLGLMYLSNWDTAQNQRLQYSGMTSGQPNYRMNLSSIKMPTAWSIWDGSNKMYLHHDFLLVIAT